MSRSSLKNVARLVDIANKDIPVDEQFLADLKRSIELDNAPDPNKKPSKTFKPSSMNCRRASYYQIVGAEQDLQSSAYNMAGIQQAGSDGHIYIQNSIMNMQSNGMDIEWVDVEKFVNDRGLNDLVVRSKTSTETKLYNSRYNTSFMCDGIIKYKGKYYIVEIKTEMSSKWYSRSNVDTKHYNQATAYSLSFCIDTVLFLYVSRDNSEIKCFTFTVTDSMKDELISYIESTNGYIERKIAPPKDDMDKRVCTYCGYKTQCKKDG